MKEQYHPISRYIIHCIMYPFQKTWILHFRLDGPSVVTRIDLFQNKTCWQYSYIASPVVHFIVCVENNSVFTSNSSFISQKLVPLVTQLLRISELYHLIVSRLQCICLKRQSCSFVHLDKLVLWNVALFFVKITSVTSSMVVSQIYSLKTDYCVLRC